MTDEKHSNRSGERAPEAKKPLTSCSLARLMRVAAQAEERRAGRQITRTSAPIIAGVAITPAARDLLEVVRRSCRANKISVGEFFARVAASEFDPELDPEFDPETYTAPETEIEP